MKSLPIVALVGQTNAGKSSLLNRLARRNIAIVAREEGTTRDNVVAKIDDKFLLVDTAGLKNPEDDFEASIQEQISDAIDSASVILVTLDSTKYFDHHDKNIAKSALRSKKPVFLILNKSDRGESLNINEFRALGIPEENIIRTSATTGYGISTLKTAISNALSGKAKSASSKRARRSSAGLEETLSVSPNKVLKIALIGRPNVGKSSLFNALAKKQQALVSSRQGTTRDVNRVEIKYHGRTLEILDTAGLRKPGKREVGIEKFSAIRTLAAIEEADICALLIDSTEPHSKLDQSLAGQIIDAGKGIIMVVTKTDLLKPVSTGKAENDPSKLAALGEAEATFSKRAQAAAEQQASPVKTGARAAGFEKVASASPSVADFEKAASVSPTDALLDRLEYDFNFLPYAPVLLTSSETGKNVTKLFELAEQIDESRHHEIATKDLNRILKEAVASHPPAGLKNTHPKPKYIVQTDITPPWFVIHGHDLSLMHWSYKRYLERKIREFYPYIGTPICFSYRSDNS